MRYGVSGFGGGDYFTSHLKMNKTNSSSNQWGQFGMMMLGQTMDIGMLLGAAALTQGAGTPSKKAVNANALATVTKCSQQIATLNQDFLKQYGTTVDTKTGKPQTPLATLKANTQQEIDRLKQQAGMGKDAKGVEQKNADYETYKTQMQTVNSLNQVATNVEQIDSAISADNSITSEKCSGDGSTQLLKESGDKWEFNSSITTDNYSKQFEYKTDKQGNITNKKEVDDARQRALDKDKAKATQLANNHNSLLTQKQGAIDSANALSSGIGGPQFNIKSKGADIRMVAQNYQQNTINDPNNGSAKKQCGTAGTAASVDARMQQLEQKLALYSDSASFDASVKKIADLITERDDAQALVDAKKNMDAAKQDKKLASKGFKKAAKADYKDAQQLYTQLLNQRRAQMADT